MSPIVQKLVIAAALLAAGCRDMTGAPPTASSPTDPGGGARTVAIVECTARLREGEMVCTSTPPASSAAAAADGPARAILGQNQVRLRSSNVGYDSTTLIFGWDLKMINLLAEPIGTPDGTTAAGSKIYYEISPYPTSYVAPYDTGTIRVHNADGTRRFTRPNQPYYDYAGIVQPGDSTPTRRWEIKVPRSVNTFSMGFRVFTTIPSEPRVPTQAPDSVPEALYDTRTVTDLPGLTGTYLRDVVTVLFEPDATLDERQAALDQIRGTVVGGVRMSEDDGFYYVTVPGDGTATPMLNAIARLKGLPQVVSAGPEFIDGVDEVLAYLRPNDDHDFLKRNWSLDPSRVASAPAGSLRWGLEAIGAPQAWGCDTGSVSTRVAVFDHGFSLHHPAMQDLTGNTASRHYFAAGPIYEPNGQAITHANQVSSIVAARGNNGQGMTGVMWRAGLMLYELGTNSNGAPTFLPNGKPSIRNAAARLGWALAYGGAGVHSRPRVINLSIAFNPDAAKAARIRSNTATAADSASVRLRVEDLAGVLRWVGTFTSHRPLLVIASGNQARTGNHPLHGPYPGVLDAWWSGYPQLARLLPDQVIAVGAAQRAGSPTGGYLGGPFVRASFSQGGPLVEIAAPGQAVGGMSLVDTLIASNGTSFAAPMVAGAAGLLLSFDPSLTTQDVKRLLLEGARRGNRYIQDATGGTAQPVLNVHESLKLAAQRRGAPLCGNRVWVEDGFVRTRRVVNGADEVESLFPVAPNFDGLHVLHGGKQMYYYDGDAGYRFYRWDSGSRRWEEEFPTDPWGRLDDSICSN